MPRTGTGHQRRQRRGPLHEPPRSRHSAPAPSTAVVALPAPAVVVPAPVVQPRRPGLIVRLLRAVLYLGLAAVALGGFGLLVSNYLDARRHFVMTDNAQVDGRLIPITSSVGGLVRAVNVDIGDEIQNGGVIARIDLGGVRQDPFSNKNRIDYDGLQMFDVVAPIDGVVVRRTASPGSIIGTGTPRCASRLKYDLPSIDESKSKMIGD